MKELKVIQIHVAVREELLLAMIFLKSNDFFFEQPHLLVKTIFGNPKGMS